MSRVSVPQVAFSSGEVAPLLHRRFDYRRHQTGLRLCRGFLPLAEGGFTRAPGTIHRGQTRANASARLISFQFAANDAVTLEFTDLRMRVWRYGALVMSGASPYELITPFAAAALQGLDWVQSADVIYLTDGVQAPQKLSRFALDNWTIAPVPFRNGPFRVQNLDAAKTIQASAATGAITLTASSALFVAGHVGSFFRLLPVDQDVPLWTGNTAVSVGQKMRHSGRTYELMAGSGSNTGVNPPTHEEGTQTTNLSPLTKWNALDDGAGVVKVTAIISATQASATVTKTLPQGVVTAPTYRWAEGAWSALHGYPSAIEMIDQRIVYAATPKEPRTLYFSAVGDFEDFDPGTLQADEAYTYQISGDSTVNRIIWLKRGRAGLHIGALGEEYAARATTQGQSIGLETTVFFKDSEIGSKPGARPISPNGRPIFISRDGRRIFEIAYNLQSDANEAARLSRPAQHLGSAGFEEIVWQSAPEPTAWIRLASGELAAMIYDPAEEVLGWAVVPVAGGFVESLAVSPSADGARDIVTMVVRRELLGATVRQVEELAEVYGLLTGATPIAEAMHLYAAQVFTPGSETAAFSVPHLAQLTVCAWTDKGEFRPLAVASDGTVTLPVPVARAAIGLLDDTAAAETLDLLPPVRDGTAMGRRRNVTGKVAVGVHATAAGRVAVIGRDIGQPDEVSQARNILARPVAADLTQAWSGLAPVDLAGGMAEEVSLRFTPDGAAPMTITASVPIVSEAGL